LPNTNSPWKVNLEGLLLFGVRVYLSYVERK
jgi:hypothetical protein